MATRVKNLSDYNPDNIPSGEGMSIGIVLSEWNSEITNALLEGAVRTLLRHGVNEADISLSHVPGSFELPLGAQLLAESRNPDAVICLGCVIQGETRHFDYICQGVTRGITELNLKYGRPFIFGVLTTDTLEQARDRSGGKHGNKGDEAAITALKMVQLKRDL
jgi:6,7-dimethyl-8-ribityllumazine synthase